jgi:hypothetical protein
MHAQHILISRDILFPFNILKEHLHTAFVYTECTKLRDHFSKKKKEITYALKNSMSSHVHYKINLRAVASLA